ncbi:GDP-fructose:GMP antiporter, putative [Plasmodium gallinaceum]|uniref:GDP-fructose:GMP antiporter, putative n=1 Tax=Plasmodium gallinaceum TaxID=5849 RepID=A0A1J1GTE7_PLAGA|nr:GDP-fructose:GMP antiporter, putative [Plasmodium gallinaceum]CRG94323.1 GDP-fructose:GMP antiporter, putative [Plasmodium gallinaceum]
MKKTRLRMFLSIVIYLISSITSVFANKYVLMENVMDTVLLIFLQHVSCLIFLFLFRKYLRKFQDKNNFQDYFFSLYDGIKNMWQLIISFNLTLIFGNICLKYTNVSSYQLARSMTLPFNFLFSYFFFKQIKFNCLMTLSCILVSIGFFVFSIDAINTNYKSVLYGTIVSIIQAIHLNLLKVKLMIYKDKMIMMHYNLIYSSIILFIYLFLTKDIFIIFTLNYRILFFLFLSCISSICVTFSSFLCIYYTDNVVFNMFGNVKSTIQTFLSKFYYSEKFNLNTVIGIILTTIGSFIYTCSSEYAKKEKIN